MAAALAWRYDDNLLWADQITVEWHSAEVRLVISKQTSSPDLQNGNDKTCWMFGQVMAHKASLSSHNSGPWGSGEVIRRRHGCGV